MATTEEFLVQIGLDPASVSKLISAVQQAKTQAEGVTIDLTVTSNAAAVSAEVGQAAQAAAQEADQAMAIFEDGIRDAELALGDLKKGLLAVSAVATVIGGFGFAQATQESEAYARANVILSFTQEKLAEVQERLRKVADETNQSYVDVAESLFKVASAGFAGEDAISAVTAASRVAVPAGIETGLAFDAIATAMTNFGLTSEEAADKLVRVGDLTRGNLANVADAIGLIGPTAADIGISLDEVGAAFAQITVQTGRAEVASTLLFNAILTFLQPAKEAEEALNKIEVTTGAAAFTTQTFAEKLLLLKNAAAEGRIEIARVFNRRALRGIQPLISSLDGYNEKLEEIADSAGRTEEASKAFFELSGPQWKALTTAIKNAATALGTDLLLAMLPVITSTSAFIKENRELIKFLGKLGLILAGLTASYLAYKLIAGQVRAVTLLVTGVTKALNSVLTFETAAIGTNVKAWTAKLTAEQAATASPIIQFIRRIITVLTIETGVVLASAKAWVVRTATGLVKAIAATLGMIPIVIAMTRQIILETAAIFSNTAAREAQTPVIIRGQKSVRALSNALRTNASQLSAAAVAAGTLGAAIVGWQLGKAADEWLGLSRSTAAFVKGADDGIDKVKNAIVFTLLPPLGVATALFRSQADAARESSSVLTGPMKKALEETAGAQEKFNLLIFRGVDTTRAYLAAIGTLRTELAIINELEEKGRASTEDLERRAEITALLRDRNEEIADSKRKILTLDQSLASSQNVINKTTEEWEKLVIRVEKEYRKLQTGVLSESLIDIEGFEKDFDLILDRLNAFTAELKALETQRSRQLETGATVASLESNAQAIEDVTKRIADTQNVLSQEIAIVQRRIIDNTRDFVSDLREQGAEELRVYQEAADKQIAVERNKVQAIKEELDKLRAIRDRSIATAERFIERLEEAELRRRDTNLAEIIRLEQQFNTAVKEGIDTEERRIRVLQALRSELERLVAPTQEELRLQQSLREIREQLDDLAPEEETERSRERQNDLLEKQKGLNEDLEEAESKRGVRRREAEDAISRATAASVVALDAFAEREKAILDLDRQRETLEQNILNIREQVALKEIEITAEIGDQVSRVDDLAKKQLGVLETAKEYVALLQQMRQAEPAAFKAAVEGVQSRFQGAIREVQRLASEPLGADALPLEELKSIIDGTTEVANFMRELKGNLDTVSTRINAQKEAIIPAAESVTQTFTDLEDVFEPSGNAIARMLESTNRFAPQIESFSDEVVNKMDAAAERLTQTTSRVAQAERRLAALETPAGGGANGLPK